MRAGSGTGWFPPSGDRTPRSAKSQSPTAPRWRAATSCSVIMRAPCPTAGAAVVLVWPGASRDHRLGTWWFVDAATSWSSALLLQSNWPPVLQAQVSRRAQGRPCGGTRRQHGLLRRTHRWLQSRGFAYPSGRRLWHLKGLGYVDFGTGRVVAVCELGMDGGVRLITLSPEGEQAMDPDGWRETIMGSRAAESFEPEVLKARLDPNASGRSARGKGSAT